MRPPPYFMRLLRTAMEGRGWNIEIYGPIGDRVDVTLEHLDGPIVTAGWLLVDPWDPNTGWRYTGGTIRPHPTAREARIGVRDLLREVQRIGGAR